MIGYDEWSNSPETRASVYQRLKDWGWHSFGDVDLGYPSHTNFATPPKRDHQRYFPEHSPDDAMRVEYVMTSAAQASLHGMRNLIVLRLEFVRRDLTKLEKARRLGVSRRTFDRRVDDALFWFYQVAVEFETAARDYVVKIKG